ncbi:hypothetical protein E2320_003643 [Naja naja]|nr:hypothetical protein E2320_003643 [Naja naja]
MEINHFMFLFISIDALEESPPRNNLDQQGKPSYPRENRGTLYYNLESQLKRRAESLLIAAKCVSLGPGGQEDAGSSLLQRERLWCGEEGRELSSVLGWGRCDVLGLTQEKLQLFVSLGKEEESDRSRDHLPRNPEGKMQTIPWMTVLSWILLKQITLKILLFTSLVSLRWTPLKTSPNTKWRRGFESGSLKRSHGIRFYFFCEDESYLPIQDHHLFNNTLNIRTEDLISGQIKIKCKCKIVETSGRRSYSPESNQLVFSVVDGLPSLLLKVDPLNQRVKEGDPLVFLCSTEGGTTEKKFHFYKDGVEITSSEEALLEPSSEPTNPLQYASLRIPHASFNHSGEFACSYEEKRSNRWIMSSWSQGVNITVEPASVSQEQFQLREKKEERNDLPVMEPQAATADTSSPVKDSEVTYSCIQNFFTPSPAGPTRKNCLTQREEERILYSDIRGQEDGDRELLQRGRLWCGEEGQGAGLGWGNDAVPALPLELEG